MHQIQKQIIYLLILHPEARYRDIKPKEVEGNLFIYHLGQLLKDDLVDQTDNHRYRLTTKGLQLADTLSLESLAPRIQPKIVTLLAIRNTDDQWLLYRRARQPFYGLLGFPYGKIHLGEIISQSAARELSEKTGLTAKLKHSGDLYLTVYQGETVVSQMFCHVFTGSNPQGRLNSKSAIGECKWQSVDSTSADLMPGFQEILRLIQQAGSERFFAEIIGHIK